MSQETDDALNAFANALLGGINDVIQPDNMLKYGTFSAELIRVRTRLGFGVATQGGPRVDLKPLSQKYIERRQALQAGAKRFAKGATSTEAFSELTAREKRQATAAAGGLSEFTSPSKSNLTLTQQMLESLACTSASEGVAEVNVTGTRANGLTNEQLAEYVTETGRAFANLSDLELEQLKAEVRQDLQTAFEKKLTVVT